jgi:hypothetical protein
MSCGCNDTSLPLSNCNNGCADCSPTNAVNLPPCVGGEPCDEIAYTDCIKFSGPNLPALGISNGDRLLTVLTKLHKVLNGLVSPTIALTNYTATSTTTTPMVVSYLGLGPVYTSTAGATSSGATITVGSTTGLVAGMTLEITAGVGAFAAGSTVLSVPTTTTFVVSAVPTTALSGGATVIKATGSNHQIFNISVVQNVPQTFKAFAGSPIKVSGTGTIV